MVLEHIDSNVDLLVEGHRVLDRKIDILHGEMNERFKEVDYKFGVVFDELHLIRGELKEKISRAIIIQKIVAVVLIALGLYLIAV